MTHDTLSIEAIFLQAVEKSPDECTSYLEEVCGANTELRQRVEALLTAHRQAGLFLETPPEVLLENLEAFHPYMETKTWIPNISGDPTIDSEPTSEDNLKSFPLVPGYEIVKELGFGGMGIVYQARDLKLKRTVAIKMILSEKLPSQEKKERFSLEAEVIARMEHPHIVRIFSCDEQEGNPYFIMEYVSGGNLDKKVRGQPQPIHDAAHLVLLLARAVHSAHEGGVVHRDLKPGNILLGPPTPEPALNSAYGCPKIADFGLARRLDEKNEITLEGAVLGTAYYMAPEQARGRSDLIGPATDIYALGGIMYTLLAGKPPFKGGSTVDTILQMISQPVESLQKHRNDIPEELEAICFKCLEKDPNNRYSSAKDLAVALKDFLDSRKSEVTRSETDVAPLQEKRRRLPILVMLLAMIPVIVLALFVGSFFLPQSPEVSRKDNNNKESGQITETGKKGVQQPFKVEFDVRIWTPDKSKRGWSLTSAGAMPVHNGDLLQLEVKLNRPAFVYMIWLDSEGGSWPLYPWNPDNEIKITKLNVTTPKLPETIHVKCPPEGDMGWRMEGSTGMETMLLLVRTEPLLSGSLLAKALGSPKPPDFENEKEVVVLRGAAKNSSFKLFESSRRPALKAEKIDDDLLQLLNHLKRELNLDAVQAIRFAHKGSQ